MLLVPQVTDFEVLVEKLFLGLVLILDKLYVRIFTLIFLVHKSHSTTQNQARFYHFKIGHLSLYHFVLDGIYSSVWN